MNKIKQRTFLLVNIAIKHRTVEHCAPCREKALGIHPIVDGIEEGRAAANGYDKKSHGKAEQKQPPQFASLIGFAEKTKFKPATSQYNPCIISRFSATAIMPQKSQKLFRLQ